MSRRSWQAGAVKGREPARRRPARRPPPAAGSRRAPCAPCAPCGPQVPPVPSCAAPGTGRYHGDVTSPWSGQRQCHIAVVPGRERGPGEGWPRARRRRAVLTCPMIYGTHRSPVCLLELAGLLAGLPHMAEMSILFARISMHCPAYSLTVRSSFSVIVCSLLHHPARKSDRLCTMRRLRICLVRNGAEHPVLVWLLVCHSGVRHAGSALRSASWPG